MIRVVAKEPIARKWAGFYVYGSDKPCEFGFICADMLTTVPDIRARTAALAQCSASTRALLDAPRQGIRSQALARARAPSRAPKNAPQKSAQSPAKRARGQACGKQSFRQFGARRHD